MIKQLREEDNNTSIPELVARLWNVRMVEYLRSLVEEEAGRGC